MTSTKLIYHIDIDQLYNDWLSKVKEIIPRLDNPVQVYLCKIWIERFSQCQRSEKDARNELINLMATQLHSSNELQFPFNTISNTDRPLEDIINSIKNKKYKKRDKSISPKKCKDNCVLFDDINTQITDLNKYVGAITEMNEGLHQNLIETTENKRLLMKQNEMNQQKTDRLQSTWTQSIEQYRIENEQQRKQIEKLNALNNMYDSKNVLLSDLLNQQSNELSVVRRENVELRKVNAQLLNLQQMHHKHVCLAFAEWEIYLRAVKNGDRSPRKQLNTHFFSNRYAERVGLKPDVLGKLKEHEKCVQSHLLELALSNGQVKLMGNYCEDIFRQITKELDESRAMIRRLEAILNRSVISTESQTTDEYVTADDCNVGQYYKIKYKPFVKKCAKQIKLLQDQQLKIKSLQRDSQLKDKSNAIRFAALKSELNIQYGDKNCKELDNLHNAFKAKCKELTLIDLNKDNIELDKS